MRVTVLGAAGGEVTGSCYLVETKRSRLLVDCGMFQGGKATEEKNLLPESLLPAKLDAVLLTHAHLDHTGRLPLLLKNGFRGPIYATDATIELGHIVMEDAARLQQQDAKRGVEPLYSPEDVAKFRPLAKSIAYHAPVEMSEGISARFFEAGHMLGSSCIELSVEEGGKKSIVVFSGDIGPLQAPIIRPYELLQTADLVFLESTYGDRDHKPYAETVVEFEHIVSESAQKRGKIIIPAFAIGRTQQILYHLAIFFFEKEISPFPVYIDSPMAIQSTNVFAHHPDLFDDELNAWRQKGLFKQFSPYYKPTPTVEESKQLNDLKGPLAIVAGSGMCTGGRIVHHLKHNLANPYASIVIVGYQGEGTLGRLLVDGAKRVRIHGEEIAVNAPIYTVNGFSAHAGQSELTHWFSSLAPCKPRLAITHGENRQRQALQAEIAKQFGIKAELPNLHDVLEV